MNIYEFAPLEALIKAAYWLVTSLTGLLEPLVGDNGAALAIILLSIGLRILLIPVGRSQVKASLVRQRLAPKIAELRKHHGDDPRQLQPKIMELYAEEKASPMAGCLPLLAQTPFLMAVYGLFILPTIGGQPNELLDHAFLGISLDTGLIGQISTGGITLLSGAVFLTIVVVIAVVAQASRRQLAPTVAPEPASRQPGIPDLSGLTRVLSFVPFITAVVAAFVPLAAALYLATTTIWTFVERLILNRVLGAATSPLEGTRD
ncbi:YidC/Oxa1 family membrane protein insertase [Stackebrandtia endophytica]|uniref:Membrane protein insertase YidC n=1 Tax=Stackebrandtia endophytica TaxID=1496996 RepID=A0A543ASM0_9ACTN|nr:YidC/Oxa1 family membrane protein insertase [Stackebrandtia endophytica]TQL75580.1 YidC/Oxa1 family membrane protein insertase [Stackebrandtia endophytica]